MTYSSACPKCGRTLYVDDRYCPGCGTRLEAFDPASAPVGAATRALAATSGPGDGEVPTCLSCGAPRLEGDDFCGSCGTPFADATPRVPDVGGPTASARGGAEPPPPKADGWHEVRLQLQEATRGEFEILSELGRGGMATVYLARDLALGRNVAIKVMAPGLLMGPGMVERFRQEAVTVANLHHPNIITIHTVRRAGNLHFFVMQVVEGSSLEAILDRGEPIPVYLVQAILYQLGVGLAYAHQHGVVHRDIKPANVLMDRDGNAVLTDFGIAKATTASNLTQTGATIGTPSYMSPEQCMARELSGGSDQYSFGVVAYEMLTGHPPFSGSPFEIMQAHTATPPPGIRDRRPDCPAELEAAVLRMLAKNPEDRFVDVAEAIEAIGGYIPGPHDPIRIDLAGLVRSGVGLHLPERAPLKPTPGRSVTPVPSSPPPAAAEPPRKRSRLVPWLTGVVTLAVAGSVAVLSLRGPAEERVGSEPPQPLPVASIGFPSPREQILVGAALSVHATLLDADGKTVSGQPVEWVSSDPAIATVRGAGEAAEVTGIASGSTTVLARAGTTEKGFEVSVVAPAAGELTVSAPGRELVAGTQLTLSAILTDDSGARVSDPDVTWASSDASILEVDPQTGVVTGRSLGSAEVTAMSGDQTGHVTLRVVGRVDAVTLVPPASPLRVGGSAVVRSTVVARPGGYRGTGGLRWSSSNPSVASVAFVDADSAVFALTGPGEAVVKALVDGTEGATTLQVLAATAPIAVSLSPSAVSFEAAQGGADPGPQNVRVTVTGEAVPHLGVVQYGAEGQGWLSPSLGAAAGGETVLTLRAAARGLAEGAYTANVPVSAGEQTRTVEVHLTVAAAPVEAAVQPNDAAATAIAGLLTAYSTAINAKDVGRVRELFPSLPQEAIDDLLRIRESDTYYLQLAPGSLRPGTREATLEGDVMSGVLGRDNRGELVRMIYTFGRGQRGWYIVSLRTGN